MRRKVWSFWIHRRNIAGMFMLVRWIVSRLVCRFRSRAVVELENLALRHQLQVLRRQRPGRLRLFTFDRLLWVLLYRLWPRCLEVMVLVKPTTVVQWHRQGFRLFWRWRSRPGRPSLDREVRDLIRQMNTALAPEKARRILTNSAVNYLVDHAELRKFQLLHANLRLRPPRGYS